MGPAAFGWKSPIFYHVKIMYAPAIWCALAQAHGCEKRRNLQSFAVLAISIANSRDIMELNSVKDRMQSLRERLGELRGYL